MTNLVSHLLCPVPGSTIDDDTTRIRSSGRFPTISSETLDNELLQSFKLVFQSFLEGNVIVEILPETRDLERLQVRSKLQHLEDVLRHNLGGRRSQGKPWYVLCYVAQVTCGKEVHFKLYHLLTFLVVSYYLLCQNFPPNF